MNSHCFYCDIPIREELSWESLFLLVKKELLCKDCRESLTPISGPLCDICSRPMSKLKKKFIQGNICLDCVRWERDPDWAGMLDRNVSLYEYNDFFKELLARFKYRGDYVLAKAFSAEIKEAAVRMGAGCVVPIPLSEERLDERGFNQAEALAREAGLETKQLLTRIHGEKQSKKSRSQRIYLDQVFEMAEPLPEKSPTILLIDDIYTTGSTLRHAARVLREAGAEKVLSFTLARG
ncbi:MAG TPA: ComF family protein [Bacillaceae bacterium]